MDRERRSAPPGFAAWLQRVLVATLVLALARVVLMALKDEYLGAGLVSLGVRSASRQLLEGAALAVAPVAAAGWLLARASARGRRLASVATLAVVLLGAYLFVGFRLPPRPYYAPQLDGARAYAAHAAAVSTALLAALVLAPRVRLPRGVGRVLAPVAVLLVLLAAGLVRAWPVRASEPAAPNLVLISLDTLRADRLGCYGYPRGTTPEIDRFAREAVRFTRAYTPEPFTLTAHMSMLTSLYPTSHGVRVEQGLPPEVPTMAELLRGRGYATLAVVDTAYWISPDFGFDRGFDLYHVMPDQARIKVDGILALLDDLPRRPFFLFAHFYDAHSDRQRLPYESSPRDMEAFAGWYRGDFSGCNERGECASELLQAMADRRETLQGEERAYLADLYDAGVRSLDRELGRLFDGLERRGLLETSVVLLTADHGEELFEHGRGMHTQNFEECLRVPLLLRPPGGRHGTTDELVSLVDVAPTLLSYCGLELEHAQGVSLAPLVDGGTLDRRWVLIDNEAGWVGLRTRRWALVPTHGRLAVFDTVADPGQERDLSVVERPPAMLARLRARLEQEERALRARRALFGIAPRTELAQETRDALRALGYAED